MNMDNRRRIVAGVIVLLVIGLGTWFLFARKTNAAAGDGAIKVFSSHTDANGKVTTETKLGDADTQKMVQLAHGYIQDQLNEYFALSAGKARKDYLDQKIDQMEQVRKLIGDPEKPSPATQPGETRRVVIRGGGGAAGQKALHETLPAEVQARLAEFQRDMAARRAERGLPADAGGTFVRINTGAK